MRAMRLRTLGTATALFLATMLGLSSNRLSAQDKPIIERGDAAVTGFSGTVEPKGQLKRGVRITDETFIDLNGKVARIYDITDLEGGPKARLVDAPRKLEISARQIGQVFGTAFDDGKRDDRSDRVPNLYLTATSMFGLQIVVPDKDRDGRPERVRTGRRGAHWMEGQFGTEAQGSPGSIWKVDGLSGEVTLFANIASNDLPNGGAGLGNIAFDPKSRQLFVSDLETGVITRLDLEGNQLGIFDHGQNGRPAKSLPPIAGDPNSRLDITNADFDTEDPDTWNFADDKRRVFGLAVRKGRLYYAVKEDLSIWSVRIKSDGKFANSARWEVDVNDTPKDNDITDIDFDRSGKMYVAQRGKLAPRYDYTSFAKPRRSVVRVYRLESPDDLDTESRWIEDKPREHAIGFPIDHRNTTGGIALGYGYNKKGKIRYGRCQRTLWTTGERLRESVEHIAALTDGGALTVHGLQGNNKNLVRPDHEPPWKTWFIDYDGLHEDPDVSGHLGDVEIFTHCEKRADLEITKEASSERCFPGGLCLFDIYVKNISGAAYKGEIIVEDVAAGGAKLVDYSPGDPTWSCRKEGWGVSECTHVPMTLRPGKRIKLSVTLKLPADWNHHVFKNCAELKWYGKTPDRYRWNNESCDYVPTCEPGSQYCGPDLAIGKWAESYVCDTFGKCKFHIHVTNVGGSTYNGPVSIRDFGVEAGATVVNWGPLPDWNCVNVGGGERRCDHGPVSLSPGEHLDLNITMQLPIPYPFAHFENCSKIVWPAGENDFNPGNELSCDIVHAYSNEPDLAVEKTSNPALCLPSGILGRWNCGFHIRVANYGGLDYFGPINISDALPGINGTLLNSWPLGACVSAGGQINCQIPGAGLVPTLDSGDSKVIRINVQLQPPPGQKTLNNCATVINPIGDTMAVNNTHCTTVVLCDPAAGDCPDDLAITKNWSGYICARGHSCSARIRVQNLSSNWFIGPIRFTDKLDNALVLGSYSPAGQYQCTQTTPTSVDCKSIGDILIPPFGSSANIMPAFNIPGDYPFDKVGNRAILDVSGISDANPANNASYSSRPVDNLAPVVAKIGPAPPLLALKLSKKGPANVKPGKTAKVILKITNPGTLPVAGLYNLDVTFVAGSASSARILSIKPPLGCSPDPKRAPASCKAMVKLEPGETRRHVLRMRMPSDLKEGDSGESCTTLSAPRAQTAPSDNTKRSDTLTTTGKSGDCWQFNVARKKLESCGDDEHRSSRSNQCVCDSGYDRNEDSGECEKRVTAPPPRPSCGDNEHHPSSRSRRCVCDDGYERNGDRECVKPPRCSSGWKQYDSRSDIPSDYRKKRKRRNGIKIWCGKARSCDGDLVRRNGSCRCPSNKPHRDGDSCSRKPDCSSGTSYDPDKRRCVSNCKSGQRWNGNRCVSPVSCDDGWKQFSSRRSIPRGWQKRRKGRRGNRIWCGKQRECSGDLVQRGSRCRCPSDKPVRSGNKCSSAPSCRSRERLDDGKCVCKSKYERYHGRCLTRCQGDLERRGSRCKCPSDRPVRNGTKCSKRSSGHGSSTFNPNLQQTPNIRLRRRNRNIR